MVFVVAESGFEAGIILVHDIIMEPHSTNQHILRWAKDMVQHLKCPRIDLCDLRYR